MKKSGFSQVTFLFSILLILISISCSNQAALPSESAPSAIETTITPTVAPTETPPPTPTLLPTPTPVFVIRSDSQTKSSDPETFVFAGYVYEFFEPAWAQTGIIRNVYETLLFYDGEKTDVLIPLLAESWEVSPDGKTYTFKIRQGIKFHNGDSLTPSDVAYSFHRNLLIGMWNQWLFTEAFFGPGVLDIAQLVDASGEIDGNRESLKKTNPEILKSICENVKSAIVADDAAGTVTMKLAQPWNAFLPSLAHPSSSIMDAKWVVENGGWDGACETWQNYYAPEYLGTPFSKIANGTGPFILNHWAEWDEIVLIRNEDYWREAAKLKRIDFLFEWRPNTVLSMMKSNTVDAAITYYASYQQQMEEFVGERCEYDLTNNVYKPCEMVDEDKAFVLFTGQPSVYQQVLLFNFMSEGSYGNPSLGTARLDGKGIPPDFFSDIHIRKAFAYCYDGSSYISDVYDGRATPSSQLILPGVIGYNLDAPHYQFDLQTCEDEFKLADVDQDGIPASEDPDDVWEVGFQLMLPYRNDTGMESVAKILAENVNSINPKFKIEPKATSINFASPITIAGWTEDIRDPYNWIQPFTSGIYGKAISLPENLKARFQELFLKGLSESDPVKRAEIYKDANLLYYEEAIGVPLAISTRNFYFQRWVQDMNLNPYYPGMYFYAVSKK